MVVYIRACFCFALIGRSLTAQSMGSHWGIGGGIQIPEMSGLEIATDTVANATKIFSLATKNSGLVAKVATIF